jgi:hypothetical protein
MNHPEGGMLFRGAANGIARRSATDGSCSSPLFSALPSFCLVRNPHAIDRASSSLTRGPLPFACESRGRLRWLLAKYASVHGVGPPVERLFRIPELHLPVDVRKPQRSCHAIGVGWPYKPPEPRVIPKPGKLTPCHPEEETTDDDRLVKILLERAEHA